MTLDFYLPGKVNALPDAKIQDYQVLPGKPVLLFLYLAQIWNLALSVAVKPFTFLPKYSKQLGYKYCCYSAIIK